MTNWYQTKKIFKYILIECNNPTISLVSPDEWNKIHNNKNKLKYKLIKIKNYKYWIGGCANYNRKIITCRYKDMKKIEIRNILWHEVLHILYPWQNHWWIEIAAQKLSLSYRIGYFSEGKKYSINDLPSREKLIQSIKHLCRRN